MLARLAFAVISAVCSGAWLLRAIAPRAAEPSTTDEIPDQARSYPVQRQTRWLQVAVLGWCGLWALIWVGIALARLRYPFELEWNGGAMRDHCERILAGRPLYVAPGPDWFPYEYPPLYFWVSALFMRLLHDGSFAPMRLVSILSTFGCCTALILWVRRAVPGRGGKTWGLIAAGIFLATYRFTGAWYDIERLDMLFLFLSLLGGYWLMRADGVSGQGRATDHRGAARPEGADGIQQHASFNFGEADGGTQSGQARFFYIALSALAFWLAFLTKQQAVLFLFGSGAALAWHRQWMQLALFAALSAVLCLGSVAILDRTTAGWFSYYCFHVPLANGIRLNLAAQFFLTDLPLYAPLIALIAVVKIRVFGVWRSGMRPPDSAQSGLPAGETASNPAAHLIPNTEYRTPAMAWCAMALLGSLLSRAHWGGDQNVLMAGFLGIILVGCMLAAKVQERMPRIAAPLYGLILMQMLTLVYRPDAQIPTAANRAAGERYAASVRKLEQEGEVLCLDHGAVTTPRHFQLMALMDVIGTEKRLPPQLLEALRSHRYAAILTDARPQSGGALDELTRDYQPTECLQIDTPWIATGFPTPGPGRQVWVLRPR